jgi:hypothetical protein
MKRAQEAYVRTRSDQFGEQYSSKYGKYGKHD